MGSFFDKVDRRSGSSEPMHSAMPAAGSPGGGTLPRPRDWRAVGRDKAIATGGVAPGWDPESLTVNGLNSVKRFVKGLVYLGGAGIKTAYDDVTHPHETATHLMQDLAHPISSAARGAKQVYRDVLTPIGHGYTQHFRTPNAFLQYLHDDPLAAYLDMAGGSSVVGHGVSAGAGLAGKAAGAMGEDGGGLAGAVARGAGAVGKAGRAVSGVADAALDLPFKPVKAAARAAAGVARKAPLVGGAIRAGETAVENVKGAAKMREIIARAKTQLHLANQQAIDRVNSAMDGLSANSIERVDNYLRGGLMAETAFTEPERNLIRTVKQWGDETVRPLLEKRVLDEAGADARVWKDVAAKHLGKPARQVTQDELDQTKAWYWDKHTGPEDALPRRPVDPTDPFTLGDEEGKPPKVSPSQVPEELPHQIRQRFEEAGPAKPGEYSLNDKVRVVNPYTGEHEDAIVAGRKSSEGMPTVYTVHFSDGRAATIEGLAPKPSAEVGGQGAEVGVPNAEIPGVTDTALVAPPSASAETVGPSAETVGPSAETPPAEAAAFTLPRDLRGAKPRFGYSGANYTLQHADDLHKALYTVADGAKRSARDADYMKALQGAFPDASEAQIRAAGASVRAAYKSQVADAVAAGVKPEAGDLQMPSVVIPGINGPGDEISSLAAGPMSHEGATAPLPRSEQGPAYRPLPNTDPLREGALLNPVRAAQGAPRPTPWFEKGMGSGWGTYADLPTAWLKRFFGHNLASANESVIRQAEDAGLVLPRELGMPYEPGWVSADPDAFTKQSWGAAAPGREDIPVRGAGLFPEGKPGTLSTTAPAQMNKGAANALYYAANPDEFLGQVGRALDKGNSAFKVLALPLRPAWWGMHAAGDTLKAAIAADPLANVDGPTGAYLLRGAAAAARNPVQWWNDLPDAVKAVGYKGAEDAMRPQGLLGALSDLRNKAYAPSRFLSGIRRGLLYSDLSGGDEAAKLGAVNDALGDPNAVLPNAVENARTVLPFVRYIYDTSRFAAGMPRKYPVTTDALLHAGTLADDANRAAWAGAGVDRDSLKDYQQHYWPESVDPATGKIAVLNPGHTGSPFTGLAGLFDNPGYFLGSQLSPFIKVPAAYALGLNPRTMDRNYDLKTKPIDTPVTTPEGLQRWTEREPSFWDKHGNPLGLAYQSVPQSGPVDAALYPYKQAPDSMPFARNPELDGAGNLKPADTRRTLMSYLLGPSVTEIDAPQ